MTITVAHMGALPKAIPPEQRSDVQTPERDCKTVTMEQLEWKGQCSGNSEQRR
jgi:hypothetical protein